MPLRLGARGSVLGSNKVWKISDMFKGGAKGLWNEPTINKIYQDSIGLAGGALESPIGIELDTRADLALSADIMTNGGFDSSTGWSLGAGWTITGGEAVATAVNGAYLMRTMDCPAGLVAIDITFSEYTSGNIKILWGGQFSGTYTPAGVGVVRIYQHVDVLQSGSTFRITSGTLNLNAKITSIAVYPVLGNHCINTSSPSRPTLTGRINFLTYTEDMSNEIWTKWNASAAIAGGVTPPTGYTTVTKITENTSNATHYVRNYASVASDSFAIVAKAAGRTSIKMLMDFTSSTSVVFNLSNGTITSFGANILSKSITDLGNGFYLCKMKANVASLDLMIQLTDANYAGDGVSGVYLTGASIGSPDLYQRVNAATDYDITTLPVFEKYDGVDDALNSTLTSFGSDMDCFIALRRDASTAFILAYQAASHASLYFAAAQSGSALSATTNAFGGNTSYAVNGADVPGGTAATCDQLNTAIPVGSWVILEVRNIDMSAWTNFCRGGYGSGQRLNGAIAGVILGPAQTPAKRAVIRKYLGKKVGLSL